MSSDLGEKTKILCSVLLPERSTAIAILHLRRSEESRFLHETLQSSRLIFICCQFIIIPQFHPFDNIKSINCISFPYFLYIPPVIALFSKIKSVYLTVKI